MLDKVLDKITEITGNERFDDAKILIDTDDKLPDITLTKCCDINHMCYKIQW